MTEWRNRIVGTALVDPAALVPNAKNYRRHPKAQLSALEGGLDEIGWIAPLTVNRASGRMVDGHARAELALREGVTLVPVQYVELTEAEEALALLTLDPIGAMATHNKEALAALLNEAKTDNPALAGLLSDLTGLEGRQWGNGPGGDIAYQTRFAVIVMCDGEAHQEEVYTALRGLGYECKVVVT